MIFLNLINQKTSQGKMTKITAKASNGKSITFPTNSPKIDNSIIKLYESFLEDPENDQTYNKLPDEFQTKLNEYLETIRNNPNIQEKFLTSLTGIWKFFVFGEEYHKAIQYLETLLKNIIVWEKKNNSNINKSSIYYFLGGTYLLNRNYAQGFLSLHSSYEEDRRYKNQILIKNTPAFLFITLDISTNKQYWYHLLWGVTAFLEKRLASYKTDISPSFSFDDFRNNFLKQADLEIIFLFSFTVIRLFGIEAFDTTYNNNSSFSAHYRSSLLFDLLVAIENAIRAKGGEGTFKNQAGYLLSKIPDPQLTENQMGEINSKEKHNIEDALEQFLENDYQNKNIKLPIRERSILISYLLRNIIAHSSEYLPIINERFQEIQQSVFNMLFLVVENLY